MKRSKFDYPYMMLIILVLFCLCMAIRNGNMADHCKNDCKDMFKEQNMNECLFSHIDSVMDMQQQKMPLCEILCDRTLVFIFSQFSCQPCVDKQIEILNTFFRNDRNINVIVLVVNYRFKDFVIFNQTHQCKLHIYNILTDKLDFIKKDSPVYLVLTKDLKIRSIYFSEKEEPEKTNRYLEHISKKYF